MAKSVIVLVIAFGCLQVRADAQQVLAHPEVSTESSLSILVQLLSLTGPQNMDAKNSLLKRSELADEQIKTVLDAVNQMFELGNLEGKAARMRSQPNSDFTGLERSRRELLLTLAANLENRLGTDGWAKFNSFLRSIGTQMRAYRGICDAESTVYTFGTTLQGENSVTAIAVADAGYHTGGGRLYAEATVRSPGNREIIAKSPASSFRIHVVAIAALPIEFEDGTYQGHFEFGELCGEDRVPRMYTGQVQ